MQVGRFVICFFALIGLVACGEKGPGNPDAYQSNSKNCSDQFVSEYNTLGDSIRTKLILPTKDKLEDARRDALAFKTKYEGVKCQAEIGGSEQTIDASARMNTLIEALDSALAKL